MEEFCEENSYLNIAYPIILRYYQIYIVIQWVKNLSKP